MKRAVALAFLIGLWIGCVIATVILIRALDGASRVDKDVIALPLACFAAVAICGAVGVLVLGVRWSLQQWERPR